LANVEEKGGGSAIEPKSQRGCKKEMGARGILGKKETLGSTRVVTRGGGGGEVYCEKKRLLGAKKEWGAPRFPSQKNGDSRAKKAFMLPGKGKLGGLSETKMSKDRGRRKKKERKA